MSKEKRKFFRLSAFNADKKRDKKNASADKKSVAKKEAAPRTTQSRVCKNVKSKEDNSKPAPVTNERTKSGRIIKRVIKNKELEAEPVRRNPKEEVESSSSSATTSSNEESSSSESESDSSIQMSENSVRSKPIETETFGTVAGITINNKNDVWGFAAAAAEAKQLDLDPKDPRLKENMDKESKSSETLERGRSGLNQLKGLFDGLSHLFATPTLNRSRSGNSPNYSLGRRKKTEPAEPPDAADKKATSTEKSEKACKEKSSNGQKRTASPNLPRKILHPTTSENEPIQMTPSNLVKTAVNSKRHELERRKLLKSEAGLGTVGFSQKAILEEVRTKKRNLIAEATQTNSSLSVLPLSSNQTGKIRLQPNYTCFLSSTPSRNCFPLKPLYQSLHRS